MFSLLLALIYVAFISLGLPDGLLGAAWPSVYGQMSVPFSYAGILSTIVCFGTISSSLLSDRLTHRFGTAAVTAFSTFLTAAALLGFSVSRSFISLCLLSIPYGLGAGGVDAALNNYVALHYESRHMSWLHCMWGVGASTGPYIMGAALTAGLGWQAGYRSIGILQVIVSLVLFMSIPLWKRSKAGAGTPANEKPLKLSEIVRLRGAKEVMVCFFCYCAAEQTAMLWGGSFLVLKIGMSADKAASLSAMFAVGLCFGRFLSGFVTMKLSDKNMIRLGSGIMLAGTVFIALAGKLSLLGLCLFGLGCAPIYPCIIHSTPDIFGAENSQAVIGVQMASAYVGVLLTPPLFGVLARQLGLGLLSPCLLLISAVMLLMHERLRKISQ